MKDRGRTDDNLDRDTYIMNLSNCMMLLTTRSWHKVD